MLHNALDRIERYLRSMRPLKAEQASLMAQEARERRASSVTTLQREVSEIQQQITDLSALQDNDTTDGDARANESRMAELQSNLAQKQRELANYQARA